MAGTAPHRSVRILRCPGSDAYEVDYGGVNAGIVPKPGREQAVARAFVGVHDRFRCWRKSELPAAWHYGSHPRVPPIVCQPDTGWRVQLRSSAAQQASVRGEHGYAPEATEMRAVFVASGPDFGRGVRLPAFDNLDVYPLLARLLGVTPVPNDGDIAPLLPALRDPAP